MRQTIIGIMVATATACFAWSSFAASGIVDRQLVVEKGNPLTLDSTYQDQVVSNAFIRDNLTVDVGSDKKFNVYPIDENGVVKKGTAKVELAAESGDVATLSVINRSIFETYSSGKDASGESIGGGIHGNLSIGRSGGRGKLVLGNLVDGMCVSANARFATIELCAAADVADDDALIELNKSTYLAFNTFKNSHDKPLRINVLNANHVMPTLHQTSRFRPYASKSSFNLAGKGDIVVTGAADAPIVFEAWSNWDYNLIASNPNACLRFEGDGEVWIGVGSLGNVTLNYTNILWNQSGDLHVTTLASKDKTTSQYKSFAVGADYALPYGQQTGNLVVHKISGTAEDSVSVDILGHNQYLNGLVVTNGGRFVSSTGPAIVTFGVGDTDGLVIGSLTDANVSCAKAGSGTLTLANADIGSLCVTGGVLRIRKNTVNHIGTLAVTNATIEVEAGGLEDQLSVDSWLVDTSSRVVTSLPSVGMTNEMTVVSSFVAGSVVEKSGPNFHTCTLPDDAEGVGLHVKDGVLRLGGSACTNEYWRFIAKKGRSNSGNHRGIATGKTYNLGPVGGEDYWVYVPVGLGAFGLFTSEGLACMGNFIAGPVDPEVPATSLLPGQHCATPGFINGWNNAYITKNINPASTMDPILGGGSSGNTQHFLGMHAAWKTENKFDEPLTDNAHRWVPNWSGGLLYTNDFVELNPQEASTWIKVTWRLDKANYPEPSSSYALKRIVNTSYIDLKDWELQSSPTGEDGSWVTMDERQDQTYGYGKLSDNYSYTYNGHIPYLFESLNAGWKFETFGAVRVDAGAVLDLSSVPMTNIAFNALTVDCAGAGRITRFRPAATGVLNVISDAASLARPGVLKRKVTLPLTLDETADATRLSGWQVTVDGVPSVSSEVLLESGQLVVKTRSGLTVIVR